MHNLSNIFKWEIFLTTQKAFCEWRVSLRARWGLVKLSTTTLKIEVCKIIRGLIVGNMALKNATASRVVQPFV